MPIGLFSAKFIILAQHPYPTFQKPLAEGWQPVILMLFGGNTTPPTEPQMPKHAPGIFCPLPRASGRFCPTWSRSSRFRDQGLCSATRWNICCWRALLLTAAANALRPWTRSVQLSATASCYPNWLLFKSPEFLGLASHCGAPPNLFQFQFILSGWFLVYIGCLCEEQLPLSGRNEGTKRRVEARGQQTLSMQTQSLILRRLRAKRQDLQKNRQSHITTWHV